MLSGIKSYLQGILPEACGWPEFLALVDRTLHFESRSAWEYPVRACLAVGGSSEAALPGAAAVFCAVSSIHLVDDMLDDDPDGDYRRLGSGGAANLALALQAAAHRSLADAALPAASALELQRMLAAMSLGTAWGQRLDAQGVASEEAYWRVVEAKTPPLFRFALAGGALLGGASVETACRLGELGALMGRMIQVNDDFGDAMHVPAAGDWQRPWNNLPMLFALTAEHGERQAFADACRRVSEPEQLARAQRMLFRSGAVSYCAFKLIEMAAEARGRLADLRLVRPQALGALVDAQVQPFERLLAAAGAEVTEVDAIPG